MISFFLQPLKQLGEYIYFNGPSKLGFWNGISKSEACAELTRVPNEIWKKEFDACDDLLYRDFKAYCIGAGIITGVIFLWKGLDALIWSCTIRKMIHHQESKYTLEKNKEI